MGIPLIDELGRRIDDAWRASDFDRASFPQLCFDHLAAADLPSKLDPAEVVRAVFRGELPQQSDPAARFGQPPVTVFRARHFFIDTLFWVDATTAIHDHAFSGAFQVLAGSSIETNFNFVPSRDVGAHLRFGELSVHMSAFRRSGDLRAITAGPGYIHSLFHLERPSVSLVVRTFGDSVPVGQFEYSPAGVACESFFDDPIRDRILQTIDMLRKVEHPKLEEWVGDLVSGTDLNTAFAVLGSFAKTADEGLVDRLVGRMRDSAAAQRTRDWLQHRRRIEFLIRRRSSIHDPNLRFMLAVLLNAQSRADALALVAAYKPEVQPAVQIAAWLHQLSRTTVRFQVGGVPFEPNVLGLPAFEPGAEEALADFLSNPLRPSQSGEGAFLERLRTLPCLKPLFS